MAQSEDGKLVTLEYNVISGNSAPSRRADMVIGKNYLEYHVQWILRTLSSTGKELESEIVEGDRAEALDAFEKSARKQTEIVGVSEVPFSWEMLGIEQKQVLSDILYLEDGSYCFVIGEDRAEAVVTVTAEQKESDKTALILMTDNASDLLFEAISAFNASSEDIYIRITDFNSAAEGLTADLFYLPLQSCMEMGRSGMLTDLYPFIEADKEIPKEVTIPAGQDSVKFELVPLHDIEEDSFRTRGERCPLYDVYRRYLPYSGWGFFCRRGQCGTDLWRVERLLGKSGYRQRCI